VDLKLNQRAALFIRIFILSAVVIAFEISLTRISSLVFTYNYAFIIVSLAILGLGTGGIFTFYKWKSRDEQDTDAIKYELAVYNSTFASLIFVAVVLVHLVPSFTNPIPFFIVCFLPFLFAGIVLSKTFQLYAGESFKLYAFDLIGASIGTVLAISAIELLGATNAVLLLSVVGTFNSLLYNRKTYIKSKKLRIRVPHFCVGVAFLFFFILNVSTDFLGKIPIRKSPGKDLYAMMTNNTPKAEIVESRWSVFGRVDLVRYRDNDRVMFLFIDGAAGTPMFKFNGNVENARENLDFLKMVFSGTFPFYFLQENEKDNMLIIGPGGGREIIVGLTNGVGKITGVEINRDFVAIVRQYGEYNGGVYLNFDNVNIIEGEGRSYLRSVKEYYDIILITQPFTKSSRSLEGYALTENYLMSVEAIKDYYTHLTGEGRIIVVLHDTREAMRFVSASLTALEEMGIENWKAMRHIYTVGREINPVIVLKKTPFSREEALERFYGMLYLKLNTASSYLPYVGDNSENVIINQDLFAISQNALTLEDFIKQSSFNVRPTTDDRPFFFKNERGIPKSIKSLLFATAVVNFVIILAALLHGKSHKGVTHLLVVALLLGIGFMMIEISLFQKLILFLGYPILSLAVVLCSILAGMGVGSYYGSMFFTGRNYTKLLVFCSATGIFVIGLFHILTFIIYNSISIDIALKVLISLSMIIPLGFLLGIPFPTGLRLAKEIGAEKFISWMYGINGTMAVLGSVLTIAISNTAGFSFSLYSGAACYLAIAISIAIRKT
jgi:hypothetical protein